MGGDHHFQITLKGANLVPVTRGFFGGSRTNPMFKLSAFQMGQTEPFYVVYESETVENNLNPVWKKSSTSEALFGDPELPVMISVFDKQPNSETPIGTIETSLSEIKRNAVGDTDQVDAKKIFKLKDANGKDAGLIVVVAAKGGVDPDEEPDEPEPEPEPEPEAMAAPQSSSSMNSIPSLDSRRASSADTNTLMELAKLQQALRDLTRKTDKLENETKDLKKETSDLRHENKELKDRVKYLENSLKQDRKLMEMAQKDIGELKKNGGGGGNLNCNGSSHKPNPSVLDGDLILSASPSADSMDDKSGKSRSTKDKHSSPRKGSSDHKSTSTLSTIDSNSDDKSKSDKHGSRSGRHGDEKKEAERSSRHNSPRRGSAASMASKVSVSRRSKDGDASTKSPGGRSMRRTRSTDGSSSTPSRPGSRRPGSSSKSKEMGSRSEKGSSSRTRK